MSLPILALVISQVTPQSHYDLSPSHHTSKQNNFQRDRIICEISKNRFNLVATNKGWTVCSLVFGSISLTESFVARVVGRRWPPTGALIVDLSDKTTNECLAHYTNSSRLLADCALVLPSWNLGPSWTTPFDPPTGVDIFWVRMTSSDTVSKTHCSFQHALFLGSLTMTSLNTNFKLWIRIKLNRHQRNE